MIKNFLIFTLLGLMLGIVVLYFSEHPNFQPNSVVEFNEVSKDLAQSLRHSPTDGNRPVFSYASAVEAAAPAVVNIFTSKAPPKRAQGYQDPFEYFFGLPNPHRRQKPNNSLGSGVIVNDQGYVLTNNHVIEEAEEIQIALQDGRRIEAKVVGIDPESDIAVLKIALDKIPAITLGQSDALRIGDVVLAIGNPFGVGQTVTMGIISATGRDQLGLNTFENFIQTDAAINPGNSGGALVNTYGHLVGINTALFSRSGGSQGIGFAIPVDIIKDITRQIIENGHVIRGWLGIEVQNISQALAESFGLNDTNGVVVAGVLRRGPADNAGLQPGDIIKTINGALITGSKTTVKRISRAVPGTKIQIGIIRHGKKLELNAITAERPLPKK